MTRPSATAHDPEMEAPKRTLVTARLTGVALATLALGIAAAGATLLVFAETISFSPAPAPWHWSYVTAIEFWTALATLPIVLVAFIRARRLSRFSPRGLDVALAIVLLAFCVDAACCAAGVVAENVTAAAVLNHSPSGFDARA